jgi:type IV secretory pathway VirB10-like protein
MNSKKLIGFIAGATLITLVVVGCETATNTNSNTNLAANANMNANVNTNANMNRTPIGEL